MRWNLKSSLLVALASMAGLAEGCGGDPVRVVNVPADQIKDVKPAPPPPAPVRGKRIGPRGGMSAILAPGSEAAPAKTK